MIGWIRLLANDIGGIAWGNRWWMTWNALLAILPALVAVHLFRFPRRTRILWSAEVVVFVLLLPNAPYLVTDLVHLRSDVALAASDAAVYAGVLPLYVAFIALGFGCYAASLHQLDGWLRRTGRPHLVGRAELGLHALCALGVLLGRVARLNSWDTIAEPQGTLARAFDTLSWRWSPTLLVILFVVIWLGHATTRVLGSSASTWAAGHLTGRGPLPTDA
jgi:uncharacterized membrane protein